MPVRQPLPRVEPVTALRPATYAGVVAALVSIAAAVVIRLSPSLESAAAVVHLALTTLLYATAGALATRLGADGWRGGMFAGLLDAVVGHTIAYLIAAPPDASRMTFPAGVPVTAETVSRMQAWGAVVGAGAAVVIAMLAGAAGGWYVRRRLHAR